MIDPKILNSYQSPDQDRRFADLLLDFTVPAMAALLTVGIFLLAIH